MNEKKWMAGVLAVTIITGNVATSGMNVYAAEKTGNKKEEVIYIMTDANGDVDSVNAVNIFGKGKVTDYGNYSSVKMLNSTDAIRQDGEKVTFSTDKNKVYYQGTLKDAQIPWIITVSYDLDGKTIAPEKLAGKSGALRIRIKIEKNNRCKTDFYDSYALQTALTLDTENCKNIKAEGATLANVGADKQISYTILPGKGLDAEITADVTDFEMDAVTINGVKLNLDMDVDDEELMGKVEEIMSASKELNKGAETVANGTNVLVNGGDSLFEGATDLGSGVKSLDEGINTLGDGIEQMQTALNQLNAQSGTLTKGSKEMQTALKKLKKELSKVSIDTKQLEQLTNSSAAIKNGIAGSYDGATELQGSLSYDKYKETMKAGGLDIEQLQAGNTEAIRTLSAHIESLSASAEQIKSIPGYESNAAYVAQLEQLEAQIQNLSNVVTLLNGNNAAMAGTSQYLSVTSSGAADLVKGLAKLKDNYDKFDSAIGTLAETLSGLGKNVGELKTGVSQLVENYDQLNQGITDYTDGVASIVTAYSKIANGMGTLKDGSSKLVTGSSNLQQGTQNLYDGLLSLDGGVNELNKGTEEFYQKTDGMDQKIEDSMDEMLDSISGGDSEAVSFVSAKNKNVESVQFVIKTAAVEKQEVVQSEKQESQKLNFWEKLIKLLPFS